MPDREQDLGVGIQQEKKWSLIDQNKPPEAKIVHDREKLISAVEALRCLDSTIVLTSGTFDILHIGHAKYLEVAKSFGDFLIVGVDSDEKVRERKGADRPVVPEEERIAMLAHLQSVNAITVKQNDEERWELIKSIRPDTLIVTQETYKEETLRELHEYCGQVVCLEPQATTSTTAKIRLLQVKDRARIMETINDTLEAHERDSRDRDTKLRQKLGEIVVGGMVLGKPDNEPTSES